MDIAQFDQNRYVNLATFRKTGAEVKTPVWFAAVGPKLYVYTAGKAGKAKRLHNSSRARFAPCDVRGKVQGEWRDTNARITADPAPRPGLRGAQAQIWVANIAFELLRTRCRHDSRPGVHRSGFSWLAREVIEAAGLERAPRTIGRLQEHAGPGDAAANRDERGEWRVGRKRREQGVVFAAVERELERIDGKFGRRCGESGAGGEEHALVLQDDADTALRRDA